MKINPITIWPLKTKSKHQEQGEIPTPSLFLFTDATTELKTSVSNGKSAIAATVTDKGVNTAASDSFSTMANNIRAIPPTDAKYVSRIDKYTYTIGTRVFACRIYDYYDDPMTIGYSSTPSFYVNQGGNLRLKYEGTVTFSSNNYEAPANKIVGKYIQYSGAGIYYIISLTNNGNAGSEFDSYSVSGSLVSSKIITYSDNRYAEPTCLDDWTIARACKEITY